MTGITLNSTQLRATLSLVENNSSAKVTIKQLQEGIWRADTPKAGSIQLYEQAAAEWPAELPGIQLDLFINEPCNVKLRPAGELINESLINESLIINKTVDEKGSRWAAASPWLV